MRPRSVVLDTWLQLVSLYKWNNMRDTVLSSPYTRTSNMIGWVKVIQSPMWPRNPSYCQCNGHAVTNSTFSLIYLEYARTNSYSVRFRDRLASHSTNGQALACCYHSRSWATDTAVQVQLPTPLYRRHPQPWSAGNQCSYTFATWKTTFANRNGATPLHQGLSLLVLSLRCPERACPRPHRNLREAQRLPQMHAPSHPTTLRGRPEHPVSASEKRSLVSLATRQICISECRSFCEICLMIFCQRDPSRPL